MKILLFIITLALSCTAQATAILVIPYEGFYKEVQKVFEPEETLERGTIQKNSQQIIIEKLEVLHQDLVKIHAAILTSEQKCETDELVSQDK